MYLSHIPHGFYEKEMKSYFSQFGDVTNIKLVRSKRVSKGKGLGYMVVTHCIVHVDQSPILIIN